MPATISLYLLYKVFINVILIEILKIQFFY